VLRCLLVWLTYCGVAWAGGVDISLSGRGVTVGTVLSTSRRFLVGGASAEDRVRVAALADDALQRIRRLIGLKSIFGREERIVIELSGEGCGDLDGSKPGLQMQAHLEVGNAADENEIIEGLSRLVLERLITASSSGRRADQVRRVPGWVVAGLARNLYPATRLRDVEVVSRAWRNGDGMALGEIIALNDAVPAGDGLKKSFCGVAFAWISRKTQGGAWVMEAAERLAGGEGIGPEWFARRILGFDDSCGMEEAWELFEGGCGRLRVGRGYCTRSEINEVKGCLMVDRLVFENIAGHKTSAPVRIEDVVRNREEKWARTMAAYMLLRLEMVLAGAPSELGEVGSRFAAVLNDVIAGRVGHISDEVMLREARARLRVLERAVARRGAP